MATSGAGKVSWVEAPAPKAEEMAVQYDGQMRIAFDAFDAGRYTEAVAHFNAAAELCAKMPKHDTASSAWVARRVKAMNNSAASKDKLGELEAAERGYAAARKVLLDAYASYSFPSLWDSSYSAMLAHVEKKMGMMPRTVGAHVGEGVDVGEVVDVGKHMAHEAVAAFKAKEYERALPLLEQAIAILEKHGRGDAITLATCINNLASTHMELGNAEPARRNYIRALQVPGTTEAQRTHMQGKLKQLNARLAGAGRGGEVQRALQSELAALVKEKGCGPILIRLSWHDAGVFAEGKGGCPNAAMRFGAEGEGAFGANAGLPDVALGLLAPLTAKYVEGQKVISHADMWALAANVAIEAMGGPHVPTRFGRQDAASAAESVEGQAGRLPDGDKVRAPRPRRPAARARAAAAQPSLTRPRRPQPAARPGWSRARRTCARSSGPRALATRR